MKILLKHFLNIILVIITFKFVLDSSLSNEHRIFIDIPAAFLWSFLWTAIIFPEKFPSIFKKDYSIFDRIKDIKETLKK